MLHEVVVPEYLFAPEMTMYAVSAAVALGFLWLGRPYLRGTEYALLGLAVLAFGASVAADQALPFDGRVTFVEDLAKFSGIVLWCLYLFRTARSMATRHRRAPGAAAPPPARCRAHGVVGGGQWSLARMMPSCSRAAIVAAS
ncbi:MAG: hypothetical protein R2755_09275 [Acidimicrobiales bacterium]